MIVLQPGHVEVGKVKRNDVCAEITRPVVAGPLLS